MSRFRCCCCCFSGENSDNERQPLLQPRTSDLTGAGSARRTRRARSDATTVKSIGKLVMRRVCVPELDQCFSDLAETFNEQQQHYEAMVQHISNLRRTYGCKRNNTLTLSECVGKIRDEHKDKYRVSLQIKGYDFFLGVVPVESTAESEEEPLPPRLQWAQGEMKGASESTTATTSMDARIKQLVGWVLRSEDQMAEQVKGAAGDYQEQRRLNENLEKNIKQVRLAKELSLKFKQQAEEVLTEAAQIAGVYL